MLPDPATLTAEAVAAIRRGWPVIPVCDYAGRCNRIRHTCTAPGKHPLVRDWPNRGTTNVDAIDGWFPEGGYLPNLGILTGRPSNLVVLDLDVPHGGAETLWD